MDRKKGRQKQKNIESESNASAKGESATKMPENKQGVTENVRVTRASIKSAVEAAEAQKKNTAVMVSENVASDNQAIAMSTETAKKKRSQRKSQAVVSGEAEKQEINPNASLFKRNFSQSQIAERISAIESGNVEPKKIVSKLKGKRRVFTIATEKENLRAGSSTKTVEEGIKPGLDKLNIHVSKQAAEKGSSVNTSPNVKSAPTSPFSKYIPFAAKKSEASGAKSKNQKVTMKYKPDQIFETSAGITERHDTTAVDTSVSTHTSNYELRRQNLLGHQAERNLLEEQRRILQAEICRLPKKKEILAATLKAEDGNEHHFYKESQRFGSNESGVDDLIQPIIFVEDKSTQTDPLPESPTISRSIEAENSATLNFESGNSLGAEAIALFPDNESAAENVTEDIEVFYKNNLKNLQEYIEKETKAILAKFEEDFMKCITER